MIKIIWSINGLSSLFCEMNVSTTFSKLFTSIVRKVVVPREFKEIPDAIDLCNRMIKLNVLTKKSIALSEIDCCLKVLNTLFSQSILFKWHFIRKTIRTKFSLLSLSLFRRFLLFLFKQIRYHYHGNEWKWEKSRRNGSVIFLTLHLQSV